MIKNTKITALLLVVACMIVQPLSAGPAIQLNYQKPDGKPGNSSKPVKVYVLAGQSNMVGMGDIQGASAQYKSVFYCADPAIIPGSMPGLKGPAILYSKPIGKAAIASHGIYQGPDAKAAKGALLSLYKGPYDANADYSKMKPAKTAIFPLGTTAATIPSLEGHTAVATAWFDVPKTGSYTFHPGFESSTHALVQVNGQQAYLKKVGSKPVIEKISLEAGKRHSIQITYFKGGSAALWLELVDIQGRGDLVTLTKKDGKFPHLLDDEGNWSFRKDVFFHEARIGKIKPSFLNATSNGKSIGPELGFGWVMGTYHDEQVLLIKTAMGNRSLKFDFRPPSSGREEPDNKYESLEYTLMLKGVRETLANIATILPGYKGQGYEITGFVWFQGHKDSGSPKVEYEKHLVNLINDVRKDLKAPKMQAVVATAGFGGYRLAAGQSYEKWHGVWEAQMAVGDGKQHPEFKGNVASVDTRDFWREVAESPRGQDYHYNRNPETYLLIGDAAGRAMVRLKGGQAENIPKSDNEARLKEKLAIDAANPVPTEEQKAAHIKVISPIIFDSALAVFMADPRNIKAFEKMANPELKKKGNPKKRYAYLDDVFDKVVSHYITAGINDYNWVPFGDDLRQSEWHYTGFDLPKVESKPKAGEKVKNPIVPIPEIVYPENLQGWYKPGFDVSGWKLGKTPLGESTKGLDIPEWMIERVGKRVPVTVTKNDVILVRKTVKVIPLTDGYRYRLRVAGSTHNNAGEGYAIWINGKLLAEEKTGVTGWRKQAHLPRGVHIGPELKDDFKGGTITIAVSNFPMNNQPADKPIAPLKPLTVSLEMMKIPEPRE